jgi:hypothetical protein
MNQRKTTASIKAALLPWQILPLHLIMSKRVVLQSETKKLGLCLYPQVCGIRSSFQASWYLIQSTHRTQEIELVNQTKELNITFHTRLHKNVDIRSTIKCFHPKPEMKAEVKPAQVFNQIARLESYLKSFSKVSNLCIHTVDSLPEHVLRIGVAFRLHLSTVEWNYKT